MPVVGPNLPSATDTAAPAVSPHRRVRLAFIVALSVIMCTLAVAKQDGDRQVTLTVIGLVVLLMIGVVEPVVRLVRNQHALALRHAQQLERLSAAAQHTTNGVVFTDVRRRITWVNEGFTRMSGYTLDELVGQSPGHLLQCERTSAETVAAIRAALRAGTAFRGEIVNRAKDGREYWLDLDIQPLHDAEGTLTGFSAIETDITEQVVQRERLASIFDTITEGVVLIAPDATILESNRAASVILGLSDEQLQGRAAIDERWGNIHRDGQPMTAEDLPAMITLRTGEPLRGFVHGLRFPDGSRRWISVSTQAMHNAHGEITSVVASFSDVTAMLDQEHRMQLVVQGSGLGTWDWHVATGRVMYNARFAEILGYELPEIEPRIAMWESLQHPEDRARVVRALTEHLDGESSEFRCEHRLRRKDGTWAWVLGVGQVTERDSTGLPIRVTGVKLDISMQKVHEARAAAAQEQYQAAIAGTSDGLWDWHVATDRVWRSPRCFELLGAPDDAPRGDTTRDEFMRSIHPEDLADTQRAFDALWSRDTSVDVTPRMRQYDGSWRWYRLRCRAQRDAAGRPIRLAGSIQDIQIQKEAECALRQARAEAEQASQQLLETNLVLETATMRANDMAAQAEMASHAKSEFLANMSHEIRTPLTAILGYADILREELLDSETGAHAVGSIDTIQRAGQHLLVVINDILDLSKIEAGALQIETVEMALPQLLFDLDSMMQSRANAKQIKLRTSLGTPIPDRVQSDPTRLRQILMNLVGNAVKFTDEGSVDVRVLVKTTDDRAASMLRIEVEDTGPGMTPKQARKLFQPFTQADASVTRKHGGTGLGLTICRRLAGLMNGTVHLDRTAPGQGSRFVVELPLVAAPDTPLVDNLDVFVRRAPVGATRIATPAAGRLQGRILLAEDGEDNRRLIVYHLTKAGAEVDVAVNGRVALELLEASRLDGRPYDLLVTDMQMPVMDGYTLARTLRKRGSVMPIIALTAHAMAEDRDKCLDAGCNDYATKPIDRVRLITTCAAWMPAIDADAPAPAAAPLAASVVRKGMPIARDVDDVLISDLADDPDMLPLVHEFLRLLPDRMALFDSHREPEQRSALASAAHQLKGAAGGYGYMSLSELARTVERFASAGGSQAECDKAINALLSRCRAALRGAPMADVANDTWNGVPS